mgnify:CR=1 FL=1
MEAMDNGLGYDRVGGTGTCCEIRCPPKHGAHEPPTPSRIVAVLDFLRSRFFRRLFPFFEGFSLSLLVLVGFLSVNNVALNGA